MARQESLVPRSGWAKVVIDEAAPRQLERAYH